MVQDPGLLTGTLDTREWNSLLIASLALYHGRFCSAEENWLAPRKPGQIQIVMRTHLKAPACLKSAKSQNHYLLFLKDIFFYLGAHLMYKGNRKCMIYKSGIHFASDLNSIAVRRIKLTTNCMRRSY